MSGEAVPSVHPARPPAVSALCTSRRAIPPTNAQSFLVPPSAQDADGGEVQEAVPHPQGTGDCVLNPPLEENGFRSQNYPVCLERIPQVSHSAFLFNLLHFNNIDYFPNQKQFSYQKKIC